MGLFADNTFVERDGAQEITKVDGAHKFKVLIISYSTPNKSSC